MKGDNNMKITIEINKPKMPKMPKLNVKRKAINIATMWGIQYIAFFAIIIGLLTFFVKISK